MKTLIITVTIIALASVAGSIIVGIKTKDSLVVENPYETGLKWDELQREKAGSGWQIRFDVNPKPVKAMSDLVFAVTVKDGNTPVTDAKVNLDLTMPGMFMGVNRPVLKHVKDGRYEGTGILPACPHGRKQWKAEVLAARNGKTAAADYLFEVK